MTYEFIYEFMYMKNIVKSYLNSCVPRFQMAGASEKAIPSLAGCQWANHQDYPGYPSTDFVDWDNPFRRLGLSLSKNAETGRSLDILTQRSAQGIPVQVFKFKFLKSPSIICSVSVPMPPPAI